MRHPSGNPGRTGNPDRHRKRHPGFAWLDERHGTPGRYIPGFRGMTSPCHHRYLIDIQWKMYMIPVTADANDSRLSTTPCSLGDPFYL